MKESFELNVLFSDVRLCPLVAKTNNVFFNLLYFIYMGKRNDSAGKISLANLVLKFSGGEGLELGFFSILFYLLHAH